MDFPTMIGIRPGAADTTSLVSYFPIPFYGILPVNAFLLRASQPVLVDTGLGALRDPFMNNLRTLIDLRDLRWLWLTHTDADHMGNLLPILAEAPNARVVTTFLGMGKMALQQLPLDRVYLLNPGQEAQCRRPGTAVRETPDLRCPRDDGFFRYRDAGILQRGLLRRAHERARGDRDGHRTGRSAGGCRHMDDHRCALARDGGPRSMDSVAPQGPQPRTERHP